MNEKPDNVKKKLREAFGEAPAEQGRPLLDRNTEALILAGRELMARLLAAHPQGIGDHDAETSAALLSSAALSGASNMFPDVKLALRMSPVLIKMCSELVQLGYVLHETGYTITEDDLRRHGFTGSLDQFFRDAQSL